jgi:hypothetical protein
MGSSGKRKATDTVRINTQPATPSSDGTNQGGAPGGGSPNGKQLDINKICPVRFRVKLSGDIQSGLDLSVEGNSLLAPDGTTVGTLDARRLKQLVTCAGLGVNYDIQTVTDEGGSYAEFQHS